jgi:hypothetical protein
VYVNPSGSLPKSELYGHFDQYVDRGAKPAGRRETPLPNGFDSPLVEPGTETLHDAHGTDTAIGSDDDFEYDVAGQASPSRLLRVVGLDLVQNGRRRDAAARPIGPPASSAAAAVADPGTRSFPDAGTATCA